MDGVPDGVPRVPEQRRPDSTPTPSEPATTTEAERPADSAALRFSVLGPVRAWRGDEPVTTGSPSNAPCSPPCCCARAAPPRRRN